MTVRETSRASYTKLKKDLTKLQQEYLAALKKIEPASNREVAAFMDIPINSITPRRIECERWGFVANHGTKFDTTTGKKVLTWVTTDPFSQRSVDRAAGKERHVVEPVHEPAPEKPQPPKNEPVREVILTKQGEQWLESPEIPAKLRKSQTEYRTQKIGIESGQIHSDMLTYWEDGYEANRQLL